MKKLKEMFSKFKINCNVKYFALLATMCLILVGVCRPIVQRNLETQSVTNPAPAKKNLPIYSVNTEDKKVAISFDAAWGADDTDDLLEILENNDVKATFFLCGSWVDKYPEEVKMLYDAGHEIGNHSDTHPHGSQISLDENKKEITAVHEKIKNLIGYEMNLYRPPFGEYNDTVLQAAKELDYHTIQWDIDSLDWKEYGVEQEIDQVLNHKSLDNGSIILFHNDAEYTPDALDTILKGLKEKGYDVVPVGELIHKEDYYMDHEGTQYINTTNSSEAQDK